MTLDKDKAAKTEIDKVMIYYYIWGAIAMLSSCLFGILFILGIAGEGIHSWLPYGLLLSGIAWLGATVLSRHTYVLIRSYLRKRISTIEFLSTNLVFVLFPVVCLKLRRDIALFRSSQENTPQRS